MTLNCTCGKPHTMQNGMVFDWRKGRELPPDRADEAKCWDCFAAGVNALCERITSAAPEELDAVFITGMASFGDAQGALDWAEQTDANEDDPDEPDVGDILWKL